MAKKKQLLKITFETPPIFIIEQDVEKALERKLKELKKHTKRTF